MIYIIDYKIFNNRCPQLWRNTYKHSEIADELY